MKFLLDQGVPRSAVAALIALGHDASHTAELGLSRANDQEIINAAQASDSVIITLDADFHTLLATASATNPSVIRIRIERLSGNDIANLVSQVIATAQSELEAGAAVSITSAGTRVRRLPLA